VFDIAAVSNYRHSTKLTGHCLTSAVSPPVINKAVHTV